MGKERIVFIGKEAFREGGGILIKFGEKILDFFVVVVLSLSLSF